MPPSGTVSPPFLVRLIISIIYQNKTSNGNAGLHKRRKSVYNYEVLRTNTLLVRTKGVPLELKCKGDWLRVLEFKTGYARIHCMEDTSLECISEHFGKAHRWWRKFST